MWGLWGQRVGAQMPLPAPQQPCSHHLCPLFVLPPELLKRSSAAVTQDAHLTSDRVSRRPRPPTVLCMKTLLPVGIVTGSVPAVQICNCEPSVWDRTCLHFSKNYESLCT